MTAILLLSTFFLFSAKGHTSSDLVTLNAGPCTFSTPSHLSGLATRLSQNCPAILQTTTGQLRVLSQKDQPLFNIELRISPSPQKMQELAPPGTTIPKWSSAVAFPQKQIIILSVTHKTGAPIENLEEVMAHEISHLVLRKALNGVSVPRWFSEGVAILQSERSSIKRRGILYWAALGDSLFPLKQIENYPENPEKVTLAYAQAADFFAYLLSQKGWAGIRMLLNQLNKQNDFEAAFQKIYNLSTPQMEHKWRSSFLSSWDWLAALTGTSVLWGLISILFVYVYFSAVKRKKQRLREMEIEEQPLEHIIDVINQLEKKTDPYHPPTHSLESTHPKEPSASIVVDGIKHTLH